MIEEVNLRSTRRWSQKNKKNFLADAWNGNYEFYMFDARQEDFAPITEEFEDYMDEVHEVVEESSNESLNQSANVAWANVMKTTIGEIEDEEPFSEDEEVGELKYWNDDNPDWESAQWRADFEKAILNGYKEVEEWNEAIKTDPDKKKCKPKLIDPYWPFALRQLRLKNEEEKEGGPQLNDDIINSSDDDDEDDDEMPELEGSGADAESAVNLDEARIEVETESMGETDLQIIPEVQEENAENQVTESETGSADTIDEATNLTSAVSLENEASDQIIIVGGADEERTDEEELIFEVQLNDDQEVNQVSAEEPSAAPVERPRPLTPRFDHNRFKASLTELRRKKPKNTRGQIYLEQCKNKKSI